MVTILKRFEIWLLFALIAAGIWWAFQAETVQVAAKETVDRPQTPRLNNPEGSNNDGLIEVKKVNLTETVDGTMIELTIFGKSGTDGPVALGDDNLELLTSEGEDIHRFFLPFDPDPLLAENEKSLVTLKYWLKSPAEVLWLTYRDQTVKVEIPEAAASI